MPAGFFTEVDSTGIVEDHIKQVLKLEKSESESILESYREVRRDLVDRLATLPRGKFTAQHVRGVLAQVEGAITAIQKQLGTETREGAFKAAMQGVRGLVKELNVFDEKFTGAVTPINLDAALIAKDTANLLATRYDANLKSYGAGLYRDISNGLFSAAIGEASYDEVVGRVSQYFLGKEWEAHRIVRTELHNVFNIGKLNGMQELVSDDTIPDLLKTLMHPLDARTGDDSKYVAALDLVVPLDEPFEYVWKRQVRTYMHPPDRPNDRSILVPYREEWGKAQGSSFIPARFPAA